MTRFAAFLASGLLLLLAPLSVHAEPDLQPGTYVLDGARYEEGCFEPCLCPILIRDGLGGTLVLGTPTAADGYLSFPITEVAWRVPDPEGFTVRGSGTYRITLGLATQHEMVLDLSIDDGPAQRYSSGLVVTGKGFTSIDIAVALNGFYCYDTVFHVVAVPSERPTSWGVIKSLFAGS